MLQLRDCSFYFGSDRIWENLSFTINPGEVYSIVGKNGCGKSSLLKILTKEYDLANGSIVFTRPISIGYLPQETSTEGLYQTVDQFLFRTFPALYHVREQLKQDSSAATLWYKYEELGGFQLEEEIDQYTKRLSFSPDWLQLSLEALSGGERRFVHLFRLLLQKYDLLLLDEPTNDLDLARIQFLELEIQHQKAKGNAFLIVSHDRIFMDRVTDKILRFHHQSADVVHGNYSFLTEQEAQERLQTKREIEVIEKTIAKRKKDVQNKTNWAKQSRKKNKIMRARIGKKSWGKDWGQAKLESKKSSAIQKWKEEIDRLQQAKPVLETICSIKFPAYKVANRRVISLEDAEITLGSKCLFRDTNFSLHTKDRVVLIGANGTGKTTLIRTCLGMIPIQTDKISIHQTVSVFYIPQQVRDLFSGDTLLSHFPGFLEIETIRNYLSANGIPGERHFDPPSKFSPGELMKAALIKAVLLQSEFLYMDEPTNHIDIPTIEMLESALHYFPGGYLIATHDRYIIQQLGQTIYMIEDTHLQKIK